MRETARVWAGLLGALLLIGVLAVLSSPTPGDTSSTGTGRAGTAALYDWLTRLGYATHRITDHLSVEGTDLLIIDNPTGRMTEGQARQIDQFAQGGGTVIVATSQVATVIPLLGVIQTGVVGSTDTTSAVPEVDAVRAHAAAVRLSGTTPVLIPGAATDVLLRTTDGDPVAVTMPDGRGRIDLIANGYVLDNDGLRQSSNARFVLALVEQAAGGRVGFDDAAHGAVSTDPMHEIFWSPLGLGIALAVAIVTVGALLGGRRVGRPVSGREPGRVPTAVDYVDSMAALIARSADRSGVARRYAQVLRDGLTRRYGLPPALEDDALVAALGEHDAARGEAAAATLAMAARLADGRPTDADLVRLAERVDALCADTAAVPV